MSDALSPGATARLLGIAPSTLRSWDHRYGIGPRERSPGGHRRYAPEDVARLRELCRLVGEGLPPAVAAERVLTGPGRVPAPRVGERRPDGRPGGYTLPLGGGAPALQGAARAAMRLDADLVETLIERSLRARGVIATWEDLAMPLLYGMGRKWEDTRSHVEVEHLLSWCVSSALRRVPAHPDPIPPDARPVVLACAPEETHSLPVEALAAALRERGVPRLVLGPCTPVDATVRTVRRTAPRAVVLWSHVGDADGVRALRETARAAAASPQAVTVYTAGAGWRSLNARADGGHLGSLPEAMRVLAPE
ncbi:MerR family transcriptional regulator [Nocardiopsis lambiniae]|uniref:MerR family transcriptional regulator n=1 Tax=Nocardiopsis lambiniae TaxID=3075539 RepID=A0ABU2MDH4_9ACTN|nr:MerR family transcriptional regulator [Nocardiopsis sp. DSM 44743]MDT0330667.1 MerR family transcriptional regulator [Nocardiopsis sp. DSM 44743]